MAGHEDQLQLPAAATKVPMLVDADEKLVLSSITEKLGGDDREPRREKPSTIYKVRDKIRNEDPGSYTPQIISIGPFHHGNEQLLPMERLKRQFVCDLTGRHPSNTLPNYMTVLSSASSVAEARSCYSERVVGLDSDTVNNFVEMLVFDGCFIIEYFVKSLVGEDMGELDFVSWNRSLVESDLLLLENQIPFFVLESLFALTVIPGITDTQMLVTLKELASSCISRDMQNSVRPIPEVVHHLLHLRQSSLAPAPRVAQPVIPSRKDGLSHSIFPKLLGRVRSSPPELNQKAQRKMLSATELHESGVKFQTKKQPGCFLDVDFKFKEGIMEIPRLSVQAVTVSQFRNLVAFEQCYPAAGNHFTAYVALMDNLIDTPEDVGLLERSGVLMSKLSNNEEVCRFFSCLGKGAHLNYKRQYLVGLFKDVNEYCESEGRRK